MFSSMVVEEDRLLRDGADLLPQPGRIELGERHAVEEEPPRVGVVEPREQRGDRGLAGARGADERDDLAGLDREVDPVQHLHVAPGRIGEVDALKATAPFTAGRVRPPEEIAGSRSISSKTRSPAPTALMKSVQRSPSEPSEKATIRV